MAGIIPVRQGEIDGLCGVYAVLNACRLLCVTGDERISTDLRWNESKRLFRTLCLSKSTNDLFPDIVCNGTEGPGMKRLIAVAQKWAAQHSGSIIESAQPKLHVRGGTARDFFERLREAIRVTRGERKAYILGLGPPWNHWTVVRSVRDDDVLFFDSWGFPLSDCDAAPIRAFTFDRKARGVETYRRHLIDADCGFLLTSRPK
ncbi:MAG: hypothetical protein CTY15_12910 [Methylocystis sp.]|nr:MAG: hypothetical protein CTY15_12910 [Methylocystis sp.]